MQAPTCKLVLIGTLLCLAGCGTASRRADTAATDATPVTEVSDSAVDISYFIGHDHHRLFAQASSAGIKAQVYLDRQILKEGSVDQGCYQDFLHKVSTFVTGPRRGLSELNGCRAPFTVTVRIGKDTHSASGCRATDDGANLGRLVRDGEFLLYSKK